MRKILVLAIAFGFSVITPALSKESDLDQKLKLAEEIVGLTQMDQLVAQLTDGIIAGQKQALAVTFKDSPFTEIERQEIFDKMGEVVREELEPAMEEFADKTAPLLADVYTKDELEGIAAFYRSPAGKAMLAKQGELMQKSMAAGQEWNEKNLPAAINRMQPRIYKIIEDVRKKS